jgi:hypothetical protein
MTRTINRPGARAVRLSLLVTPLIGLAVAVLFVWQASYAAFTATTSNGPNNWTTGSVVLSNNTGTAMFSVTNIKPGDFGSKCIVVTSSGTVPSTVKLYGAGLTTPSNGLSSALMLTITQGTGNAADCTGFTPAATNPGVYSNTLANFTASNYNGGYSTSWAPTGSTSENRTFRFDWALPAATGNPAQNATAGVTFTWEAQS